MKRLFVFLFVFFTNSVEPTESVLDPEPRSLFQETFKDVLYFSAAATFGSLSLLTHVGARISQVSSAASTSNTTRGNEFFFLSHLLASASHHVFSHLFKDASIKDVLPSSRSWQANQRDLSEIPASSEEEKRLLTFLENRWLSKATGYYPSMINWVYPCFGVSVQVNPDAISHYTRNPSIGISPTYQKRSHEWKQSLPHPLDFPLILTRPSSLQGYLPSYIEVPSSEKISTTIERIALEMQEVKSKVVLDLTDVISTKTNGSQQWQSAWDAYQAELLQRCKDLHLNESKVLCVQRVQQGGIGGLRLLPFTSSSKAKTHRDHRFLLKWISALGLSANRVELDWPLAAISREQVSHPCASLSKDAFAAFLDSYDQSWTHPQKTLMLKGTLQILEGLLTHLTEEKWSEIMTCTTKRSIAELSFFKIREELQLLAKEEVEMHFFGTVSHIEQIHASLTSLLEIISPYTDNDFPTIYRNLLTYIPESLKRWTSCAVHSAGMTSVGGILKAVEKTVGRAPHVLYGENAYFECIHLAEKVSNAVSMMEATESDWKEVDLIIAQFNPALKRIDLEPTQYRVEKVAEALHKTLNLRQGKPLTLALDCTFDFINSPRVGQLLDEFQKEIADGILNIICYRSGLKFDLFGMDNYAGAPFFMIHNQDSKWTSFDSLITSPALQTDRLSLNWFCLAYQNAAPQLELYRKQIFDNTRALLNKVPARLFNTHSQFRIVSFDPDADAGFIDIKISGSLHKLRGAALVGGSLSLKCMEGGHPVFYRPSVGFYHPNFTMIFSKSNTTIRLTLGLDPAQVDLLAECFEMIDTLNGSSLQTLQKLLQSTRERTQKI